MQRGMRRRRRQCPAGGRGRRRRRERVGCDYSGRGREEGAQTPDMNIVQTLEEEEAFEEKRKRSAKLQPKPKSNVRSVASGEWVADGRQIFSRRLAAF